MAKVAKKGNWIAEATRDKGAYRAATKTPEGKNIPASRVASDAKKSGKIGKEARLAQTLAKMRARKKSK